MLKGILILMVASLLIRALLVTETCWVEMTAVMPRAKNMPAMVTMKGWISRYPMKKPCTMPKTRPISSISGSRTPAGSSHCSTPTAMNIHSMAMSAPTEISMPPVIITAVIPQTTQIRPALFLRISRKTWSLVKPLSA